MHPDPVLRPSGRTIRALDADARREGRWSLALVLVAILATVLMFALSGCCVSRDEHGAFVEAARLYHGSVGADGAAHNARCAGLGDLSRRNRAAAHAAFGDAIAAAESRLR